MFQGSVFSVGEMIGKSRATECSKNGTFSEVGGARPGKDSEVCNRGVVCGFNIKMHILPLEQLFSLTPLPACKWSFIVMKGEDLEM